MLWVDTENVMLSLNKSGAKGQTWCDSMDMTYPVQANSRKRKEHEELGHEIKGRYYLLGTEFLFNKKVLEMDSSDGFTTS